MAAMNETSPRHWKPGRKMVDYTASYEWIGRAWLGRFAPDLCQQGIRRSEIIARFDELMDAAQRLADEKAQCSKPSP